MKLPGVGLGEIGWFRSTIPIRWSSGGRNPAVEGGGTYPVRVAFNWNPGGGATVCDDP
jgi:hypothetical protein